MLIWLYWRRLRPAVLAVGLAICSLAVLAMVAGLLAGPSAPRHRGGGASGRTGAQLRAGRLPALPAASRRGLSLMTVAARACQDDAYSGTQEVDWWGRGGSTSYVLQIWHRPGAPELAEDDDEPGESASGRNADDDGTLAGQRHAAAGVLALTPRTLPLLRAHFRLAYAGTGTASGRAALLVSVWRPGGTLAAQFWLDRHSYLPLRRQLFDSAGHLVSEGTYLDLKLGGNFARDEPSAGTSAWHPRPAGQALAALRAQGWLIPASIGELALIEVTSTSASGHGPIVDASYSDGLSVVSVFVQRGELPASMPGWHHAAVGGQPVYSAEPDERSLTWSAGGFVYTVIADAPPQAVALVVAGLPHQPDGDGFWDRVGRGLARIGSWFNPFDLRHRSLAGLPWNQRPRGGRHQAITRAGA